MEAGRVQDIMTQKVSTLKAGDGLDVIAQLFEKYDFDGLPVVDDQQKLLGIITEYDMVIQSLGMHLPTVIAILDKISADKADKKDLDAHFNKLRDIKASQIMNASPLTVNPQTTLQEAARLFAVHHRVNPLCVVDMNGVLVGVLSRYDVIKFFNAEYLQQIVETATTSVNLTKKANVEQGAKIGSEVSRITREFLLVGKKRPVIWKVVALAAFIAGLIVATALIIRLVRRSDDFNMFKNHPSLSTQLIYREMV